MMDEKSSPMNMPIVPMLPGGDLELGVRAADKVDVLVRGKRDTGELVLADTLTVDRKSNSVKAKPDLNLELGGTVFNVLEIFSKALATELATRATAEAVARAQATADASASAAQAANQAAVGAQASADIALTNAAGAQARADNAQANADYALGAQRSIAPILADFQRFKNEFFQAPKTFLPKILRSRSAEPLKIEDSCCKYEVLGNRVSVYVDLRFRCDAPGVTGLLIENPGGDKPGLNSFVAGVGTLYGHYDTKDQAVLFEPRDWLLEPRNSMEIYFSDPPPLTGYVRRLTAQWSYLRC